jgi:membrane associated rhomboid family serine protease
MRFRDPRSVNLTLLWVLIAVNVLIFIATSIASGSIFGISFAVLNQIGVSYSTFSSQPWTIVSSMFAHDGIYHIIFNMLTLYFFGMYVLALVGEARFFLVYFIGGLVGNVLFLLINHTGSAVGASGAIFALGGLLVVLVPRLKVMIFPIPIPMDLWIALLLSLAVLSFLPGIAWQAHVGGFLTGLAAGYFFKYEARRRRS